MDGTGLLENSEDLAPGKPRDSAAARENLIWRLVKYQDAADTSIILLLSAGAQPPSDTEIITLAPTVEILYSRPGQSMAQFVEAIARRHLSRGSLLVVTDWASARASLAQAGATISGCQEFMAEVEHTVADLQREVVRLNEKEQAAFSRNG